MLSVFLFSIHLLRLVNESKINIISFDVPYPADYGGVIDIFYKLKALNEAGIGIILHCFHYGRQVAPELEKYCQQVIYYKRNKGIKYILSSLPYVVITRKNSHLLNNLKNNSYPILFEGIHTSYFINHPDLRDRIKILRMHNIEHRYYEELAKASTNPVKKGFYKIESKKLLKFESVISHTSCIAAISENDHKYYNEKHKNVRKIGAFHPLNNVVSKEGKGDYFLYHGNLTVEENEKAVTFLIDHVFSKISIRFVIAGKSSSNRIQQRIKSYKNIELIENPDDRLMIKLIEDAQCNVLPTFQATGMKLKLLISLFNGRHVIANRQMVENTDLEPICILANSSDEFIQNIKSIKNTAFSNQDIKKRKNVLQKFSNKYNAKKLIETFQTL